MTGVFLATEDELSESLGEKLVNLAGLCVDHRIRRNGAGYLRSRIKNFCEIARRFPVVLITDLDMVECPVTLKRQWLGANPVPDDLIFRVAVREIESWVLADHQGIYDLMGDRVGLLPDQVDLLADPKRVMLDAASRARRDIREELVTTRGALASQGMGYNQVLSNFIRRTWSFEQASQRSPSLRLAFQRVQELQQRK